MTPQEILSLLQLIARLQAQVAALEAENAELRQHLELATSPARDGEELAQAARQMAG